MFKFRLENRANLIAGQADTLRFFSEKILVREKCARTCTRHAAAVSRVTRVLMVARNAWRSKRGMEDARTHALRSRTTGTGRASASMRACVCVPLE